jgi:beta-aspartyl-peptidase (threonine type)
VIILGSANAVVGLDAGWQVLASGGSALDAVEVATRLVEDNPDDHTVGFGGYPNLLGEVELDASIMDGATRRAGAVGALRGHRAAITLARRVMEDLPHVLVVGEGAARFARECGMQPEDLLSDEAREVWQQGLDAQLHGGEIPQQLAQLARLTADPERAAGTVNVLARDGSGHIASAVSTSGWAWKYPGRLGDSPVIGAGNYADDRHGAAACTGFGELSLRAATARGIVAAMAGGVPVGEACVAAIRDLADLGDVPPAAIIMSVVALDRDGAPSAASTNPGAQYAVRDGSMAAAALLPRAHVDLRGP